MATNDNPNWTQDHRGQWHWTPTKEMCIVEEPHIFNSRGDYFNTRTPDGMRRGDGRSELFEKYGWAAL